MDLQSPPSSVLERRGCTLPEISVIPQDFSGPIEEDNSNSCDAFNQLLQYLYSPATSKTSSSVENSMASLSNQPIEPSLATPKVFSEAELEHFFVDIRSEIHLDVQTESLLNKTFLTHLSNNNTTKRTVLPRKQFDFTSNRDKNSLLPAVSITPTIPIVLKKTIEDNKDQFNVYFPECPITPTSSKSRRKDGVHFQFPEDPNFSSTADENKENSTQCAFQIAGKKSGDDVEKRKLNECSLQIKNKREQFETSGRIMRNRQNIIERKRRVEQHQRFRTLASHIPHLSDKEKIPKIRILKAGICYIKYLENEEVLLEEMKRKEQEKLLNLQMRFEFLTNTLVF